MPLLLVVRPLATSSFLLPVASLFLVVRPGAPSSFLLLVVRPFATSSERVCAEVSLICLGTFFTHFVSSGKQTRQYIFPTLTCFLFF